MKTEVEHLKEKYGSDCVVSPDGQVMFKGPGGRLEDLEAYEKRQAQNAKMRFHRSFSSFLALSWYRGRAPPEVPTALSRC